MTERFTLLSELGRGGMGVVWKARDEETGQFVALKLLHPAFAADPDYRTRFERELELAKRIQSANVVKVLGYGARDGVPYLALEYIEGPSLREALATHGPYTWNETRALLAQIAQGLADAHRAGVIHRDVKPSNVLIAPDGTAKLTDFGIARGLDLTRVTATSTLLGTPAYLPPEGPEDERSDLYSLGVIGYELLAGAPPFEGKTYQSVMLAHIRTAPDLSRIPAEARPIIGGLLAKEPGGRPRSAGELAATLRAGNSAAQPTLAAQPTFATRSAAQASVRPTPVPGPARRSRTPVLAVLAALGLVGVVVVAALIASQPSTSSTPAFSNLDAVGSPNATRLSAGTIPAVDLSQHHAAGSLVICSDTSYPPQESMGADGQPTGSDIQIGTEIASRLALTPIVTSMPLDQIAGAVNGGTCDIGISGETITAAREQQMDMIPYFVAGQAFVVLAGSNIKTIDDLCGKTVAARPGSIEADHVNGSGSGYTPATSLSAQCESRGKTGITMQADFADQAQQALRAGIVAADFVDEPVAGYEVAASLDAFTMVAGMTLERGSEGIDVAKTHSQLRDAVRWALQSMMDDGTYLSILRSYGIESCAYTP
jgi:serine/threonine protein kinase